VSSIVGGCALVYCAAVCVALAGLDYYTFAISDTNHTGLPMSWLLAACVVSFFAAGVALARRLKRIVDSWVAWCVLVVSACAIANVVIFDVFNFMMEYERWAAKGLPRRPW
jgi:hypothetical protein